MKYLFLLFLFTSCAHKTDREVLMDSPYAWVVEKEEKRIQENEDGCTKALEKDLLNAVGDKDEYYWRLLNFARVICKDPDKMINPPTKETFILPGFHILKSVPLSGEVKNEN